MWWKAVILGIVASVFLHAFLTRLAPTRNAVALFLAAGIVVGIALCGWMLEVYGPASIEFVSALLIYAAFCELYLFLFTLALTSVSANILVRLRDGPRDPAELDELYDDAAMVETRLLRMQAAGFVQRIESSLNVTSRGRRLLSGYHFSRSLFRHD